MNLRQHDQVLLLHQDEAVALCHALRMYHHWLTYHSSRRPLYVLELLSVEPTARLLRQLERLTAGSWPRDKMRRLKARRWHLQVHEVVLLNSLYLQTRLFSAQDAHDVPFMNLLAKVNAAAHNVKQFFEIV
ncbi:hypothetical protein [Hymenobacter chitinivorans]|uniref:Uncharacterized protein n=1 Tax=Hymenobacter chitinivorans DSM 11115 TaxID=1121954 RepID=A0A2M9BN87_9BACT|nr:hypothetical protein [Hymenobacter chitinivorans]PJJ59421.1 hypothetical protein CLV45_0838 [Hymenobacter chitinivorans DSM 11115]